MQKIGLKLRFAAVLILISIYGLAIAPCFCQEAVSIAINPSKVEGKIDNKIYGHFLEHIFHSVNGGLWGELIWNRSFEQNKLGEWVVRGETIAQEGMGTNVRLTFGDTDWRDYEYTLEARKTSGQEGFLILFRVKNE